MRAAKTGNFLAKLIVRFKELINDFFFVLLAAMLETFFDNVTSKFMVTKLNHTALDAFHDAVLVFLASSLLKYVLDHIVAELIFGQSLDIQ